jgi:hypothetical protein
VANRIEWPPIDHRHDIVDHMVLEQENTGDECNLEVVDLATSVTPFTEEYVADLKESCSTTEYFCHARRRSKEVNLQNRQYRINAKHQF